MKSATNASVLAVALAACTVSASAPTATATRPPVAGPRFTAGGELEPPVDYRSWVFLTSGFAMSYGPAALAAAAGGVDVLDNVFVAPAAYQAFLARGVWPEHTMFVLEIRTAEETGSIVTRGRFQTELVGIEAAVKDSRRFASGWGYFDFATDAHGPTESTAARPQTSSCNQCHAANAAVEHTFTQFYPTLLAVARARGTVRADFPGLPPGAAELTARVVAGGWPAAQKLLDDTAARWPQATMLREATLNRVGYELLAADRPTEAIAMFEQITRRFPASANAWDSLSEAYEGTGAKAPALAAIERGLAAAAAASPPATAVEQSLRDRKARLQ